MLVLGKEISVFARSLLSATSWQRQLYVNFVDFVSFGSE